MSQSLSRIDPPVEASATDLLTIGAFAVRPGGRLRPRSADRRPALRFAWRGRACEAELSPDRLRLAAIVGRVPSTAESCEDRRATFTALEGMPPDLPAGWHLGLTPDHRIQLGTETIFADHNPPTIVTLVAAMVRFALVLDPYLDRLAAAGATSLVGTAKT